MLENLTSNEWTIPAFVFFAIVCLGGALLVGRFSQRRPLYDRINQIVADGHHAPPPHGVAPWKTVSRVGAAVATDSSVPRLKPWLARAGFYGPDAMYLYLGAKVFLFFAGVLLSGVLVVDSQHTFAMQLFVIVLISSTLSFLPNLFIAHRRLQRSGRIRQRLPDSLDLLDICVTAGLGLDSAWNAVGSEMRTVCSELADEMALTNLELHLGGSRATAMRNMAERTGVSEIASFVAVLVQSERFGTSISDAVRSFATSLREQRSLRAQEAAEKMAVKLLFPLVIFIFPALFAVLVGPAGIRLIEHFGHQ